MIDPGLPADESARLAELRALAILDTPREDAFDNLMQLAASIFGVPIALVALVDEARQWFKAAHGLSVSQTPRDISFCTHVVFSGEALVVEDAACDPRFADNPLVTGAPYVRFYAGEPLRSDQGFVLGTLCLIDTAPRRFEDAELARLRLLARQAEQLIRLHRKRQRLADEARRSARIAARYQAITEGAAAAILRIDGRGRIIEVNRFACALLGYDEGELRGQNVRVLMPEPFRSAHDGYLEAYQRTGLARVIGKGTEVDALHRDGSRIPVQLTVSEVGQGAQADDFDGRHFIGMMSDLRDVHQVRERERQERALLEVLHRGLTDYHALISGNTLWAFLKDALCALTGSTYGLIGEVEHAEGGPALKIHAITDLSWNDETRGLMRKLVSGDMRLSNPASMLGRVFAGGEVVRSNTMQSDPRGGAMPPGHPPLWRYLGVPITHRGEVIGMFAIANAPQDYPPELVDWLKPFTSTCALLINLYRLFKEQQRFTEQLQQARDQAEKASQAKTEFLSSMSHELRTPLNAILGFAQLLQNGRQPLPERQLRQVEQIARSGRHLLQLINEVLDLARIESGNLQVSLEPLCAHDVIHDATQIVLPLAEHQGIALALPPAQACALRFEGDYTRVKQILINLLGNAVKYNRPGGSVEVRCEAAGGRCRITVADTGIGIPASRLGELFQPFNRLGAEAGSVEGTGVGLALTRKLVDLMHGELGVRSREGEGSEFWFELPLCEHAPAQRGEARAAVVPQALSRRYRVLHVEDNPANRQLMQDVFEDLGQAELYSVDSAAAGIEAACSDPPDLILMDIDLPGMNGLEAQALLARNPLTAHVPVLAISAAASPQLVRKARAAGFIDYVTKPFDIPSFVARVGQILEHRSSDD